MSHALIGMYQLSTFSFSQLIEEKYTFDVKNNSKGLALTHKMILNLYVFRRCLHTFLESEANIINITLRRREHIT